MGRLLDIASEIEAISSPSGHTSKRALKAAQERIRGKLFPGGLQAPKAPQPSRKEYLMRRAALLRDMASRGTHPIKYRKEADRLEAEANQIDEGASD